MFAKLYGMIVGLDGLDGVVGIVETGTGAVQDSRFYKKTFFNSKVDRTNKALIDPFANLKQCAYGSGPVPNAKNVPQKENMRHPGKRKDGRQNVTPLCTT